MEKKCENCSNKYSENYGFGKSEECLTCGDELENFEPVSDLPASEVSPAPSILPSKEEAEKFSKENVEPTTKVLRRFSQTVLKRGRKHTVSTWAANDDEAHEKIQKLIEKL
jgi:hypothetical protein